MNINIKLIKGYSLLFFILSICVLCSSPLSAVSYTQSKDLDNCRIDVTGGFITNIDTQKGIAVIKSIEPHTSAVVTNNSDKDLNLKIKMTNIAPALCKLELKNAKVENNFNNYSMIDIRLSPQGKGFIKMLPVGGEPDEFTFAVYSDSHLNSEVHQAIFKEIESSSSLFAICVGDILKKGDTDEYKRVLKEMADFKLPLYFSPGNHDVRWNSFGYANFTTLISPVDYSFNMGKFHFIMLDNSRGAISKEQYEWLISELKGNQNNFIFMHVPPKSPVQRWENKVMNNPKEREYFMSLMKEYKVKAIFSGHLHGHSIMENQGTLYVLAGPAGGNPYLLPHEGGYWCHTQVHVKGDSFTLECVKLQSYPPKKKQKKEGK